MTGTSGTEGHVMRQCWLDRVRHRRLSGPLSAMATRSGVSPNVVTLAGLAVGLAAARRLAGEGAGCPFWPWSST